MKVKEIIKSKGFTIKQVAEVLDKNYVAFAATCNNPNINTATLREIADAIGCKVGDFFADEISSCPNTSSTLKCPHCGKPVHVLTTLEK